jgi:hypothetical protein
MSAQTLLLTGSVPGSAHVGEIILRDLVLHYGPERVHCVAIVPAEFRSTVDPGLPGMRFELLKSPDTAGRPSGNGLWARLGRRYRFLVGFGGEVARLTKVVVASARASGVHQIFAVLNNALTIAVSQRAAAELGIPLVSLVWDPPEYVFRQAGFDRWSRESLLCEFRNCLAASTRVAVVSETMQRDFAVHTQARIHLLRHGIALESTESTAPLDGDEWLIGFAGSMYSDCAWRALTAALDQVDWRVAGRPVRLRLLTGRIQLSSRRAARMDYLGFRPPDEVQSILQACHLTYLPQPFVAEFAELCRYSFPTKLANYLALGRPVLVHCPDDSALAEFVRENPVGVHVASLDAERIIEALHSLLCDPARYAAASRRATETARVHFSDSNFRASVDRVLEGTA